MTQIIYISNYNIIIMVELFNPKHDKSLNLLKSIKEHEGITLTQLSKIHEISIPYLCTYIKELEKCDWVKVHKINGTNYHFITDKGHNGILALKILNGTLEYIIGDDNENKDNKSDDTI